MEIKRPLYATVPSDHLAHQVLLMLPYLDGVYATIHTLADTDTSDRDHIALFASPGHYRKSFLCCSSNTFARRGIIVPDFAKRAAYQVSLNPAMAHAFGTLRFKEALRELHRYYTRMFIKRYAPKGPARERWSPHSEYVS